jgi:hypothetical protein
MATSRLNVTERLLLVFAIAAVFAILGFLIAHAASSSPSVSIHLPNSALIPRGETPFMQTVKAFGTNGGGFFTAPSSGTPLWTVMVLGIGLGPIWLSLATMVLRPRQRPEGIQSDPRRSSV